MDTIKLDDLDIVLPYVARELCIEAVELADELRGDVPGHKLQEYCATFLKDYMELLKDISIHGMPDVGFDPFNLSTIPESLIDDGSSILQLFEKFSNSKNFMDTAISATFGEHDLQSVAMLLFHIEMLQKLEVQALIDGMKDYKATMAVASPQIQSLHQLIVAHKSLPHQAEIYANNLKRKRGARKGGAAKASRMKELQEVVLSEAREFHSSTSAAKAAQSIFKKLSDQGVWLQGENGKDLLKDPSTRFTAWIRADRSPKSE